MLTQPGRAQRRSISVGRHEIRATPESPVRIQIRDHGTQSPSQTVAHHCSSHSPPNRVGHSCHREVVFWNKANPDRPGSPSRTTSREDVERLSLPYAPDQRLAAPLRGKLPPTLQSPRSEDGPPRARRHPVPKAMVLGPLPRVGLKSSLHRVPLDVTSTLAPRTCVLLLPALATSSSTTRAEVPDWSAPENYALLHRDHATLRGVPWQALLCGQEGTRQWRRQLQNTKSQHPVVPTARQGLLHSRPSP